MKKKRVWQSIVSLLLALILLTVPGISVLADEDTTGSVDPENWIPLEEYEIVHGTTFDYVDSASQEALMAEAQAYPAALDLRDLGYITPVRSQYPFGSCWTFAAMAAAESSLISSGMAAEDGYDVNSLNLSEKYLAISVYSPFLKEGDPQNGEGYTATTTPYSKLNRGGNAVQASVGMSTGFGIVLEDSHPEYVYKGREGTIEYAIVDGKMSPFGYSTMDDWEISQENRFTPDYVLKESYMLPSPVKLLNWEGGAGKWKYEYNEAGTNAIKKQLMAGRAVQIGYYAERSSPSQGDGAETKFLSDKWAHYGTQMEFANHAVTIVGWDDNYPAGNFLLTPQGDGAWLVKNSWGSGEEEFPDHANGSWGLLQGQDKGPNYEATSDIHTGYFWLSYYDHSISNVEATSFERVDPNEIIDAHDYMIGYTINAREHKDEIRMANIFKASVSQELTRISYYTTHPNTTAHWQVYLLPEGIFNPDMGILVEEGTQTHEFGGFHKVSLPEPVVISSGQRYVIAVTETLPDGRYTVNVSVGEKDGYKRIINGDESLCYKEGTWMDLASEPELLDELATNPANQQGGSIKPPDVCDNFLIRGYAEPLEDDVRFSVTELKRLVFVSDRKSASVTIKPSSLSDLSAKEWSVEWKCLKRKFDTENLVTIEPYNNGFSAKISARKENNQPVTGSGLVVAEISADGKKYGTVLLPTEAFQVSIESLSTESMNYDFPYTGEEIKPEVLVYARGVNPKPGEDCTITYSDNVKTGIAKVTATSMGDVLESSADMYFAITPAKAELESVEAGEQNLTATVKDLTDTGLTTYQFWYRPKGSTEWIKKTVKAEPGKKEYVLEGLTAGVSYEVRVCGLLEVPEKEEYKDLKREYTGEFSEVLTSTEILQGKIGWVEIEGKWYYRKEDGTFQKGWFLDNGTWYYLDINTGERKIGKTSVEKDDDGVWRIRISGETPETAAVYTGFGQNENGWWYLENGRVTFAANDILGGTANVDAMKEGENGWWLVRGSKVVNETTVAKNENGWWYVKNGKVDFGYTGVRNNENGWWAIQSGKVNFNYNGFLANENGWWYLENGKVTFERNDILSGKANTDPAKAGADGWWLIRGSKVMNETTVAKNANGWWYVKDGKVDFGYTGVRKNEYGWWAIQDGKVNFTYRGFLQNENGWWYLENGRVSFSANDIISGIANNDPSKAGEPGWWLVEASKVPNKTTVAKNANGWWYLRNGKVDFGYTGLATNSFGTWYIENGKVNFDFTGDYDGYRIVNGKVA